MAFSISRAGARVSALYAALIAVACADAPAVEAPRAGRSLRVGSEATPNEITIPDPVELEALAASFALVQCAVLSRCSAAAEYYTKFDGGCLGAWTPAFEAQLVAPLRVEGRARYDGAAMTECLERLAELDCAEPASFESCRNALDGTLAEQSPCASNLDCTGPAVCSTRTVDPVCADWICTPPVADGESCAALGSACAEGSACVVLDGDYVCTSERGEGASCDAFEECAGNLYCRGSGFGPGNCKPLLLVELGEACSEREGVACRDGSCQIVDSDATGFLTQCVPFAESGGPCHVGLGDECPFGEYCPLDTDDLLAGTFSSNCVPLAATGEPCDETAFVDSCGPGSYCAGVCEPRGAIGEACASDTTCWSGHCSADFRCGLATRCADG